MRHGGVEDARVEVIADELRAVAQGLEGLGQLHLRDRVLGEVTLRGVRQVSDEVRAERGERHAREPAVEGPLLAGDEHLVRRGRRAGGHHLDRLALRIEQRAQAPRQVVGRRAAELVHLVEHQQHRALQRDEFADGAGQAAGCRLLQLQLAADLDRRGARLAGDLLHARAAGALQAIEHARGLRHRAVQGCGEIGLQRARAAGEVDVDRQVAVRLRGRNQIVLQEGGLAPAPRLDDGKRRHQPQVQRLHDALRVVGARVVPDVLHEYSKVARVRSSIPSKDTNCRREILSNTQDRRDDSAMPATMKAKASR